MDESVKKSLALAQTWQRSIQASKASVLREEQKLAALVYDKHSKNVVISLIDQAFRSENATRVVNQFAYLLSKHGLPSSFSGLEKLLIRLFKISGKVLPKISLLALRRHLLFQTRKVILNNNKQSLTKHIKKRAKQGFVTNYNLLGELVLGEIEARERLKEYLLAMENPAIHYISVKLSGLYSQIHPLAYAHSKEILKDRLRILFTKAVSLKNKGTKNIGPYHAASDTRNPCFVNLDMEEYKDIRLTIETFMEVLSEKEFKDYKAGIVLQAYLPDSLFWYKKLLIWAKKRVHNKGAAVKLRLVKGANLEIEKTESALHGWELPIFASKQETDANYKKLLTIALKPKNIQAMNLGVASHNLFDLAYAKTLADMYAATYLKNKNSAEAREAYHKNISLEMLEGIFESGRTVIKNEFHNSILYAPAANEAQFIHALSYLVRRLDENTSPENYLRHSFDMKLDSPSWNYLKNQFIKSHALIPKLKNSRKRKQDRSQFKQSPKPIWKNHHFKNEADSDFHLEKNLAWAENIQRKWGCLHHAHKKNIKNTLAVSSKTPVKIPILIPVKIANKIFHRKAKQNFYNPNIAQKQAQALYSVSLSSKKDIYAAAKQAQRGFSDWANMPWQKRAQKLLNVAEQIRQKRADLIACMALVTGKVFTESDVEINEAIDFAQYYPKAYEALLQSLSYDIETSGKGTILVVTPWNFPLAIPAGGILAALMAGNSVILKPAPEAMPIAWLLAQCFWKAGIPGHVLQLINCQEGDDLAYLVQQPSLKSIIFTGGTHTVLKIMQQRDDILISAETGGKNAIIVSAMADRDQAIKHILESAFSNSGQKCSAASIVILEKELFDSPSFKRKLKDACQSLEYGSAFNFKNILGPLITPPNEKLQKPLKKLEHGQSWLVSPKQDPSNPRMLSPSILWNLKKKSHCYKEELFGPLLSVMKAKNFRSALKLIPTNYGLTSGLESLDQREIALWKEKAQCGNLYVNRSITGAIVNRQPFGGFLASLSAFGSGLKAGGPNYLIQFMDIRCGHLKQQKSQQKSQQKPQEKMQQKPQEKTLASAENQPSFFARSIFQNIPTLQEAMQSYHFQMQHYFMQSHDPSKVYGQDNLLRYLKNKKPLCIRAGQADGLESILLLVAASLLCQSKVVLSVSPENLHAKKLLSLSDLLAIRIEDSAQACAYIRKQDTSENYKNICFIRSPSPIQDKAFRSSCAHKGLSLIEHAPHKDGRLELIYYLQEQSISEDYHRYGNLLFRDSRKEHA